MSSKVFVSGSMKIKHLDPLVQERLDNILDSHLWVIVGDADGIDAAVQAYLKDKKAKSVVVYCAGEVPRNNLGKWRLQTVWSASKPGTRDYYTAKDLQMADDCNYGLMVWDTKSTGTLSNAIELLKRGKPSVVFVNKTKEFVTVRSVDDLEYLVMLMSEEALKQANRRIDLGERLSALTGAQGKLFGA